MSNAQEQASQAARIGVDKPRHEPRLRLRVEVVPQSTSIPRADDGVFTGRVTNKTEHGVQEVMIYKSDLDLVRAKVETRKDLLAVARETYVRERRAWVQGKATAPPPDDEREWTEGQRKLARRYTGSMEGAFRLIAGRGPLPLASLEVLGEEGAPLDPDQAALQSIARSVAPAGMDPQTLADAMVQAMVKAGWSPPGSSGPPNAAHVAVALPQVGPHKQAR